MREGAKKLFARKLRRDMTDAEQRLWFHLRRRQMRGCRFRRQVPIRPYILDFACLEARLVVEVDGSQHLESAPDATRANWLEERGFRVLRFWNHDVLLRTRQVLGSIRTVLAEAGPHPDLPPQAGEGEQRVRQGVRCTGGLLAATGPHPSLPPQAGEGERR